MSERERENWMRPDFYKTTHAKKDFDRILQKQRTQTTTPLLLIHNTFAVSPTFSYWPIPNIIIIIIIIVLLEE